MKITLATLQPGQCATVTDIRTPPELQHRLRAFGLVPGTEIRTRYRSPDRTVTALELRGTVLALRTRDLRHIQVTL